MPLESGLRHDQRYTHLLRAYAAVDSKLGSSLANFESRYRWMFSGAISLPFETARKPSGLALGGRLDLVNRSHHLAATAHSGVLNF